MNRRDAIRSAFAATATFYGFHALAARLGPPAAPSRPTYVRRNGARVAGEDLSFGFVYVGRDGKLYQVRP